MTLGQTMIVAAGMASVALAAPPAGSLAAGRATERRQLQSAQMAGGAPPSTVTTALCDIGSVFANLMAIKGNAACIAGCDGGASLRTCPSLPPPLAFSPLSRRAFLLD